MHRYGLTESGSNLQDDYFDKGGMANDRLNLSVCDVFSQSWAFTVMPPEGQSRLHRTSLYYSTNSRRRPPAKEVDLPHELTNFVSNRMIGGGTGTCLQEYEAMVLEEAWSDAVAEYASDLTPATVR
ncbi:hypothetical protein V5O48_012680 [Marasmius crinis-equi]|uniref:Extracellular metalloproteinase n=1 Tax=Marasmius crinis-equi TaxID=585013 RepID=A0ABR3F2F3_9AGAR